MFQNLESSYHRNAFVLHGRYMSKEKLAKFTNSIIEIILEGKNHLALMPENITKYQQNITVVITSVEYNNLRQGIFFPNK